MTFAPIVIKVSLIRRALNFIKLGMANPFIKTSLLVGGAEAFMEVGELGTKIGTDQITNLNWRQSILFMIFSTNIFQFWYRIAINISSITQMSVKTVFWFTLALIAIIIILLFVKIIRKMLTIQAAPETKEQAQVYDEYILNSEEKERLAAENERYKLYFQTHKIDIDKLLKEGEVKIVDKR